VADLPAYAAIVPGVVPTYAALDVPGPPRPTRLLPFAGASNAWAASVARSATGSTLLASDPHLGLTAPSIFYLARLELQEGGVIGATIPGLPLILSGRSADLGWGVTSSYLDDTDVFVEEVNPANAAEYRTPDGWAPFEARDTIIGIKDAPAVTVRLQWTANGPVLGPEDFDLGTVRPPATSWPCPGRGSRAPTRPSRRASPSCAPTTSTTRWPPRRSSWRPPRT
jgi:penicillin amidase